MKRIVVLFISLLAVSCAKLRQEEWPASLRSLEGFSSEQESQLRGFADDLNSSVGRTLVNPSSSGNEGYPIFVKLSSPPASDPHRAGFATQSEERCLIELSPFLFDKGREDYRKSVFLHELGHCGGLGHTNQKGDIMYPTAAKWSTYDAPHLQTYFQSLLAAVGEGH